MAIKVYIFIAITCMVNIFSTPIVQATIYEPSRYKTPAPTHSYSYPELVSYPIATQPYPNNRLLPTYVPQMGTTTCDIENSNNAASYINPQDNSGNGFGNGTLPGNPIEPGTTPPDDSENTPIGDVPWGIIAAIAIIYILKKQKGTKQFSR